MKTCFVEAMQPTRTFLAVYPFVRTFPRQLSQWTSWSYIYSHIFLMTYVGLMRFHWTMSNFTNDTSLGNRLLPIDQSLLDGGGRYVSSVLNRRVVSRHSSAGMSVGACPRRTMSPVTHPSAYNRVCVRIFEPQLRSRTSQWQIWMTKDGLDVTACLSSSLPGPGTTSNSETAILVVGH